MRNLLRGIATETLKGNSIPELSKEVNGQKQIIRQAVPGWVTDKWARESKRAVERELARRNRKNEKKGHLGLLDDVPRVFPSGRHGVLTG